METTPLTGGINYIKIDVIFIGLTPEDGNYNSHRRLKLPSRSSFVPVMRSGRKSDDSFREIFPDAETKIDLFCR